MALLRILSNAIQLVSGGVRIQFQACLTRVYISKHVGKFKNNLRLEKMKSTTVNRISYYNEIPIGWNDRLDQQDKS